MKISEWKHILQYVKLNTAFVIIHFGKHPVSYTHISLFLSNNSIPGTTAINGIV